MSTGTRTSHSLSEELGSELVTDGGFAAVTQGAAVDSGLLTIGNCYKIALRTDGDFIAAGSPDNVAGTYFNATTTGVGLLDAGDTVNPITFTSWTAGAEWAPQAVSGALTGKANKIAGTASDLVQATAAGDIATDVVTLANMRISAVAGTSFVDFSAAAILTGNIGKVLMIKDSAGKVISGYIKAAGTGETFGAEELRNPTWDDDATEWGVIGGTGTLASSHPAGGGQSDDYLILTWVSGSNQRIYQASAGAFDYAGLRLYKFPLYIKSGSSGNEVSSLGINDGLGNTASFVATTSESWVKYAVYINPVAGAMEFNIYKTTATPGTMFFDEASFSQVLTPSATGVTIVSTLDGSTYNWTYQQTGFNYNDAAGYTYYIDDIKVNRVAATVVRTAGTLNSDLDGVDGASITADGTYYDYLIAGAGVLSYQAAADFAGSIDAVSCKEVVRRGTPD